MQKEATQLCSCFNWSAPVSVGGSRLRAEVWITSLNAIPMKAPFMGKPLWKRIGKGPPYPEQGLLPPCSLPEYLHPPPENKPACTDTAHSSSCCLYGCHCSFAFLSMKGQEGRKTVGMHHGFLWTKSLSRLQAAQKLNLSRLLRCHLRTRLACTPRYPVQGVWET